MADHYRMLGLPRAADEGAIRAAYLELMRRYHPDQNAPPDAAERAKSVSSAYAVLGDPQRRAAYDRHLAAIALPQPSERRRPPVRGRGLFLVIATLTAGLLGFTLTRPALAPTASLAPAEPRLSAAEGLAHVPTSACPDELDAAAVRRELFAAAPSGRAVDRAAFELAAANSRIRLSTIAEEGSRFLGTLRCRATLALELPIGLTTRQGSGTMVADVSFAPREAKSTAPLQIEGDELLMGALLAVGRATLPVASGTLASGTSLPGPSMPQAAPSTSQPIGQLSKLVRPAPLESVALAERQPVAVPNAPKLAALPSVARTASAANLAALERHQSLLFDQSYLQADERKRARLIESRDSFLARLGLCSSDDCRRDAYLGRNQEIVAIMRG